MKHVTDKEVVAAKREQSTGTPDALFLAIDSEGGGVAAAVTQGAEQGGVATAQIENGATGRQSLDSRLDDRLMRLGHCPEGVEPVLAIEPAAHDGAPGRLAGRARRRRLAALPTLAAREGTIHDMAHPCTAFVGPGVGPDPGRTGELCARARRNATGSGRPIPAAV